MTGSLLWIVGVLEGDVTKSLCVLAIAMIGFSMLAGRVSVVRAGQVILGCFILLGAPAIAASIMDTLGPDERTMFTPVATVVYEARPREPLPEATYDPYAGASLSRSSPDSVQSDPLP